MLYYRGVPQIEVTFDIDVNGILHVTAADKAARKSNTITITNEKGLSEEQIKRMVEEAEKMAEDDKRVQERIDSRNKLENYIYNMRSNIKDNDKLANKLGLGEKENIESALNDALEWLEKNPDADKLDNDERMAELEVVFNSIIKRAYENGTGNSADDEDEFDFEL